MKIAFFTPAPFDKKFGAAKNRIELSEALIERGHHTYLIGNKELGLPENQIVIGSRYNNALKEYLLKYSGRFDIVLYEYDTLPFERKLFSKSTVFIARPALVDYHFDKIQPPVDLKTKISRLLNNFKSFFNRNKISNVEKRRIIYKSLSNTDIIQVQNTMDKNLLSVKFPDKKIILIPNGIGEDRFLRFQNVERNFKNFRSHPKIAFVGTFDYRKGAMDFKYIINEIVKIRPEVEFWFLGSLGIFPTKKAILSFFPKRLRKNIKIIPRFKPENLPSLLGDCHLGIFPSYLESFGFGALEMMCSGLPVLAYISPGPCDFILKDLLFQVGDKKALVNKLTELLQNENQTIKYSNEAKVMTHKYRWKDISKRVEIIYKKLAEENY